jgi:hypothetical protein
MLQAPVGNAQPAFLKRWKYGGIDQLFRQNGKQMALAGYVAVEAGVRLCREYRWTRPTSSALAARLRIRSGRALRLARCMHPSARKMLTVAPSNEFLVAGIAERIIPEGYHLCSLERADELAEHCGPSGKFWEPQDR